MQLRNRLTSEILSLPIVHAPYQDCNATTTPDTPLNRLDRSGALCLQSMLCTPWNKVNTNKETTLFPSTQYYCQLALCHPYAPPILSPLQT